MAVRGLALSNLRSTIRLKAMAQVRAQPSPPQSSRNTRQPGQPWFARAATAMEAKRERQGKNRMRQFNELSVFPHHGLRLRRLGWGSPVWKRRYGAALRRLRFGELHQRPDCNPGELPAHLILFLLPPGHELVLDAQMIQHARHHGIDGFDRRSWGANRTMDWPAGCRTREQQQLEIFHMHQVEGVSRGTRISFRRSFSMTSAARSSTSSLTPWAIRPRSPSCKGSRPWRQTRWSRSQKVHSCSAVSEKSPFWTPAIHRAALGQ